MHISIVLGLRRKHRVSERQKAMLSVLKDQFAQMPLHDAATIAEVSRRLR